MAVARSPEESVANSSRLAREDGEPTQPAAGLNMTSSRSRQRLIRAESRLDFLALDIFETNVPGLQQSALLNRHATWHSFVCGSVQSGGPGFPGPVRRPRDSLTRQCSNERATDSPDFRGPGVGGRLARCHQRPTKRRIRVRAGMSRARLVPLKQEERKNRPIRSRRFAVVQEV